jgi:hypothetical protein
MYNKTQSGISLVGTLVGVAVLLLVFLTLFSSFHAMLTFAERNRLRANALMLANEHIETIRALPYDSVGTVAGLPPGAIPQNETITFDGKSYNRRTFIQYVDDDADGLGVADTLTADYKRVKVELSYSYQSATSSFAMVTTIAPPSQESLTGAGILRINVTDAVNNPVPTADVHVFNNTIATTVDITTFTNASGTVSLPGAWEGNGYEVYVGKTGYSSAQTYTSTTSNPNPSPSPYNVAENSTTEVFFKIDLFSTIDVRTRAWPVRDTFYDDFVDTSGLATTTNTQVSSGALILAGAPGSYSLSGSARSLTVTPPIGEWLLLSFENTTPPNTSVSYQIEYDTGGGIFALIPDVDLPQNSIGFTTSPIGLHDLDTTTYDSLRVVSNLSTTDPNVTPEITEYTLSYHEANVPIPNVTFSLRSGKTIGTDSLGDPIYKYDNTHQTNGSGVWQSGDMEFDTYELTVSGYNVAEACPSLPLVLEPDVAFEEILTLEAGGANNLRVTVNGPAGTVGGAAVRVVGGATDITRASSPCGIAFFPSLTADTYDIFVEAAGLESASSSVSVSGDTSTALTLTL